MKRYSHDVTVPFAGSITATIESDDPNPSEQDIADAVGEMIQRLQLVLSEEKECHAEVNEWDVMPRTHEGNITYLPCTEATIDSTTDNEGEG